MYMIAILWLQYAHVALSLSLSLSDIKVTKWKSDADTAADNRFIECNK